MESIQDYGSRIKRGVAFALGQWGLVTLVLLVAFACFGFGRLSALVENKPAIVMTEAPVLLEPLGPFGMIVAQKNGSLYFFPWCSGAQQLSDTQKVWFQSEKAAQRAGYSPAKNCRGLGTPEVQ